MKQLIQLIAENLVDRPEKVIVGEIGSDNFSIYELSVAKDDLGKIIGKNGKTAEAIRIIINAVSGKKKKKMMLEIVG